MTMNWRGVPWLLAGTLASVGFGHCLWSEIGDYRDQKRKARQYRSVRAEMLYSHLAVRASSGKATTDTNYTLRVRYRYQVGGKQYESAKFRYHEVWSAELGYWERMHQRYAKGNFVTAYYNPEKPADAVLVKRPQGDWYWRALVAFGFLLLVSLGIIGIGFYNLFGES